MLRLGCSCSVFDFVNFGSSDALRTFSTFSPVGSALSVYGMAKLGSSTAIVDFLSFGSSFSVRSFARLGSRLGSTFSVYGTTTLGSALSIIDYFLHDEGNRRHDALGLELQRRRLHLVRILHELPDLCAHRLDRGGVRYEAARLRVRVRTGSALAVYGTARLGSSMAVLDFVNLSSALSLLAIARSDLHS